MPNITLGDLILILGSLPLIIAFLELKGGKTFKIVRFVLLLIVGIAIIWISITKEVADKEEGDKKDAMYNSKLRDLKAQNEDFKNQLARARDSVTNFEKVGVTEVKEKKEPLKPKTLSKTEISEILNKVYAQQQLMKNSNKVMLCYGLHGLSYPAIMSQLRMALKRKNFEVMGTHCTVNMGEKFSRGIHVREETTFNAIQIVVGENP
jgi:hypothetical protein